MWSSIGEESSYSELRITIAYAAGRYQSGNICKHRNKSTFFNFPKRLGGDRLLLVQVIDVGRKSLEI